MSAASDNSRQENCEGLDGKRKENENKRIVRGNNSEVEAFVAEDNTRYNINDSAYYATGSDIPYAIGTIKEIKVSKKDFAIIFVKTYYRTTELPESVYQMLVKDRLKKAENSSDKDLVSRKECRTRELFLCKDEDASAMSFPVSKLRGKCSVTFLEKFNDARDFDFNPDCFFYHIGFNTDLRKLSSIEGDSCEGSSFKWTATERGCLQKANIPDLLPRSALVARDDDDGYEKLVWEPGRLLDTELLAYIRNARSIAFFIGMCDGGSDKDGNQLCQQDGTTIHALKYLVDANYCPREAINHLIKNPIPPTIERKWTEEQVKRFVKGLRQNGKDFVKMRKDHLPAKTRAELVEFYYIWKKGSDNLMIQPQSKVRRQATIKKKGNGEAESSTEIETESEESEPETPFICRTCQKSISENRSDHMDLCSKCRVTFYKYGDGDCVFDMIDFDAEPDYESDIRSEFSSPFDVDAHHHNSGAIMNGTPHFMFKPIKEKMNEKSPSPPNPPPQQPLLPPPPQPTTTTVKIDQQQQQTTNNNQQSSDNNNDATAAVKSEIEKKAFKRQWDGEESGHEVDDVIGMKRLKTNELPPPQPLLPPQQQQQQQEEGDAAPAVPQVMMDVKPTTAPRSDQIHRHWSTPTTTTTTTDHQLPGSGELPMHGSSSRRLYHDPSAPNNHPQPPPPPHVNTEQLPPTTTDLQHHHPHQSRGHHHMSSIVTSSSSSSNNFTASAMSVPSVGVSAVSTNHMIPPQLHHHPRVEDRKNNVVENCTQQQNYTTNCGNNTKAIQQQQQFPTEQQQSNFQPTHNHNHPRSDSHYIPQSQRPHEPQRPHEQQQQRPHEPQRPQEQHQQRQHESQQRQANEQHANEQQQQRCSELEFDVENVEIYPPVLPHHHITLRPGEQIPANFQFYTEPRPYTPGKYNRVHETKTFKFYGHPDSTCSRTDFVWKSLKQQELMKQEQQKQQQRQQQQMIQQQQQQQQHNEDTKLFDPDHHHHHRLRDNMSSRYEDRNMQQQQDHQARDHVVTAKREIIRPVPVPVNHHPSHTPHVHTSSRATPTGASAGAVMTSQQHASSVYDLHRPRSSPYTSRLENSASRTLRHYAGIGVTSQRGDHPSVMTSSAAAAVNHYSAFDSMQAADREMREREIREIQREQLSKSHITSSSACSVSMVPSVMTSSSATSSAMVLEGHKLLTDHHTSQQQVATAAAIEQFNAVQAAAMGLRHPGLVVPPPGGAVDQLQRQSFAGLLPGMGNTPHPLANAGFPPILSPHDFPHNLDHNRIPADRLNPERLAMEQQFRMDLMHSHHQHAHIHSHLHLHQPNMSASSTPSAPQMLNGMIPNSPADPLGTYNSMMQQIQAQQQAFAGIDVHTAAMMANPLNNPLLHLSGVRPPTSVSASHPSAQHPSSYLSAANLSATQQLQAHAAQEHLIEQRALQEEFYRFANATNHNHKP